MIKQNTKDNKRNYKCKTKQVQATFLIRLMCFNVILLIRLSCVDHGLDLDATILVTSNPLISCPSCSDPILGLDNKELDFDASKLGPKETKLTRGSNQRGRPGLTN